MKDNQKKHTLLKIFCLFIIFIVCIILYGKYINTTGLKVNEIPIYDSNLNEAYNGLKIAHFSDIHYGRTTNEKELKILIKELNNLNADIIIFTGDLFDSSEISDQDQELITTYLKEITAKQFKFAIIGDYDESYLSDYAKIMENSNFTLLNNSSKLIYNNTSTPLNFIGITNLDKINDLYTNTYYNITLTHKPDIIKDISNTNLAFAGHSLGGQIKIPYLGGIKKISGASIYINDFYQINNTKLYISSGIGTQDISFRLFNKPSINLYRLYTK